MNVVSVRSDVAGLDRRLDCMRSPWRVAGTGQVEAEVEELKIRHRIEKLGDPVQAAILEDKLVAKHAELARERERAAQLIVTSASDGLPVELLDFKVTAVPKTPRPPQELSKTDSLASPRS